jgi:Glycoside hydrolase family 44
VSSRNSYNPPDTPSKSITYLNLATTLAPGKLDIVAGTNNYTYTLPQPIHGNLGPKRLPINPHIYGVNWPKNANYIKTLGVTVSRWGGNAVTPYNPFDHFTNAGNDWFFENRVAENGKSDEWINWIQAAGSDAIMTVPALDWVSKDATSYSYPKTLYPGMPLMYFTSYKDSNVPL